MGATDDQGPTAKGGAARESFGAIPLPFPTLPDHAGGVTGRPRIRISIELSFSERSLAGDLRIEGGPGQPFDGWLELMTAVEALRPGTGAAPAMVDDPDGSD